MTRILLAEDTIQLAEEISDILRLEKFDVVIARNGREALDLLIITRPDVVITDLLMPVMDGFELIEKIKSNPELKSIPVITLSAKAAPEDRARAQAAGADRFVQKPCKAHELISAIRSLL